MVKHFKAKYPDESTPKEVIPGYGLHNEFGGIMSDKRSFVLGNRANEISKFLDLPEVTSETDKDLFLMDCIEILNNKILEQQKETEKQSKAILAFINEKAS